MGGIFTGIPESDVASARELPADVGVALFRRLMASLYDEEIVGGSASCMLSRLENSCLHDWRAGHLHVKPLGRDDYELERRNLDEWLTEG